MSRDEVDYRTQRTRLPAWEFGQRSKPVSPSDGVPRALVWQIHPMTPALDLAQVARLFADPTRARMLSRLMDGRACTAGELARDAGVTPQTASGHLSQLLEGGVIRVEVQGRHRYARLADAQVARALEALGTIGRGMPPRVGTPEPLRFARTCYDHLAGRLAVDLADALERRSVLVASDEAWEVTESGARFLARLGVDVARLGEGRRVLVRRCLDWSERRPHLAGALGAALLGRLFELRWIARRKDPRAVRLTVDGRQALSRELGLDWPDPC